MSDNCEKCGWPMTIMAGGDEMHCGRKYYQNDYAFCLEKQNDKAQQELKAANESFKKLNIHTLNLVDRIRKLEEELERTKQDRNAIAKNTREPLLWQLDHAAERIKQLEDRIDRAAKAFFADCPDEDALSKMLAILEEERGQ